MTTLHTKGEWHKLDDAHEMRFVEGSQNKGIIGAVFKHKMKGTDAWCEPGLVQWEPYGELRPLFTVASEPNTQLSITPFIVCEICGEKGFVHSGQWVPKEDEDGVDVTEPMKVLEETNHTSGFQEGKSFDGSEYQVAIRRDLGDKVPEEERNRDAKLIDVRGGPDVILPTDSEEDLVFVGTDHDPQWQPAEEPPAPYVHTDMTLDEEAEQRRQLWQEDEERRIQAETFPARFPSAEEVWPLAAHERPLADSGQRRTMETGAQRDRASGKGRFDLLQVLALPRLAIILEKGAAKYDERNWEKGMPLSVYVDSAFRHLTQYIAGKTDEDHLGQAAWNLLAAMQTEEMISMGIIPRNLDDLPHYYDRDRVDGDG